VVPANKKVIVIHTHDEQSLDPAKMEVEGFQPVVPFQNFILGLRSFAKPEVAPHNETSNSVALSVIKPIDSVARFDL